MRFVILSLLLAPVFAVAADLRNVTVDRVDGHYLMHSETWFDVPVEQMFGVMLDYDLSTQFSSVIEEARNVEPDDQGRPQFYSLYKACILFFCVSFERNGYVVSDPNKMIMAISNPETSDFDYSKEIWLFESVDGGTILTYDVDMKPSFWIPPVIGPYYIKKKLKNSSADAIDRIEEIGKKWPDVGE